MIERLRELGLADRTLLAFVSDHGTEFLDHDDHFHGQHVYGELNRVPMFFWGPGYVPSGVVLEPTVQTIDLMPTVLGVAGIEPPPNIQGEDLMPLMRAAERGEAQSWTRPAITEKAMIETQTMPGRNFGSIALIADGWKLIRNDPVVEGKSEFELYDHRKDPLNLNDLASAHPERVAELAGMLTAWQERATAARLDDSALEADLDAAELERLRDLGYVQ